METQNEPLFNLNIDANSKAHLLDGSKWAKFLAIVGFIMCGLLVVLGIFAGSIFNSMSNKYGRTEDVGMTSAFSGFFMFVYIVIAVLYFFPCLFLYRYADLMKASLNTNDQEKFNRSVQNLKIMFRYVGVLTIIVLVFYLIGILAMISAG